MMQHAQAILCNRVDGELGKRSWTPNSGAASSPSLDRNRESQIALA